MSSIGCTDKENEVGRREWRQHVGAGLSLQQSSSSRARHSPPSGIGFGGSSRHFVSLGGA